MSPGLPEPGTESHSVVRVPAELRFLAVLRLAVAVITDTRPYDDGCRDDLQLATDELASVLIPSAREGAELTMSVRHDEDDIYVRMTADVGDSGFRPDGLELTRMLLDDTVDSYDVAVHDGRLIGVVQRRTCD